MALDATIGGANADTYVLEPAATALVPRLVSPEVAARWTAATVTVRENALARAAFAMNDLESRFVGLRAALETQALAWPRTGAVSVYSRSYTTSEIPVEVIHAQVIYAAMDVAGEIEINGVDDYSGIVSESAGPVSATYRSEGRARGFARVPAVMMRLGNLFTPWDVGASRM